MVVPVPQRISVPQDSMPPAGTPTIYADGILNIANSGTIVKFYMMRLDPFVTDVNQAQTQVSAQVIMPMDAFINTFAFLERAVETLIAQKTIPQGMLDHFRKMQAENS